MAEWKLSVNTLRKNSSSISDEDEEFPEPPSLSVGPIAVKTAPQDESIPATVRLYIIVYREPFFKSKHKTLAS